MKPRILFLCTGNSARSQMAEALARLIAGDHVEVESAGTQPVGLNPFTVACMQELAVDVQHYRSKHVNEFVGQPFDYVITVCDRAKQSCPVFPDKVSTQHWSFEDPTAASPEIRLEVFRRVRDEIRNRICQFFMEDLRFAADECRPMC